MVIYYLHNVADCPMVVGADSVLGVVADPCNCQNYVQCEYNSTLA